MSEKSGAGVSNPSLWPPPSAAVVRRCGRDRRREHRRVRHLRPAARRRRPTRRSAGPTPCTRRGSPPPPRPPGAAVRRSSPRRSRRPWTHPVGHASGVLRTRRRVVPRGQERLDRLLCRAVALVGEREHLPGRDEVRRDRSRLRHVRRSQERERLEHVGLRGHPTHRPGRRGHRRTPPAARGTPDRSAAPMKSNSQAPPQGSFMPRRNPGCRKLRTCSSVRPAASPRRMSVRTADAGTPPPKRPPESIHPSTLRPDGFFAYAASPPAGRRSARASGPPTTIAPLDGHGAVASAVTAVTDVDVVDVGVDGDCVGAGAPTTAPSADRPRRMRRSGCSPRPCTSRRAPRRFEVASRSSCRCWVRVPPIHSPGSAPGLTGASRR